MYPAYGRNGEQTLSQDNRFQESLSQDGRYRLLVESISDYAIYMLDPTGIVSSWNNGARRFKGYEPHEIIGQHFSRFYTEEDKKQNLPARALSIAEREGKFESEGWRVRKDGTRFWAHVVIDPILTQDGKIAGFAKITRDLTERKISQAALRRSEEQFKLLVQGVTDYAIYMLDPGGNVSSWNLGAERIKGYKAQEIIGEHFSRFYTEEDRAKGEPKRALETAAREGKFEKEGWRVKKDGTRFAASVVIDALRDEGGKIIGFAKITRDISERRESEMRLEKAREALFQSQKMEAVGQLTGGVAHDFNNLLMVVLGSLELLRKRMPLSDEKVTQLIDNAIQGAKRGSALTQRMLAFARRQELKREPVLLPILVEGMTDLLERSLGPSITIQTKIRPSLRTIMADGNQIELGLLNLAVNARDAMPDGGTLCIQAHEANVGPGHPHLEPGDYICLSVGDTGEGMDAETLARATEPFFTTKGVGKGTGLGLSMVHGMTLQSGGKFILKSEKGKGTTAEMWFPAGLSASEALAQVRTQVTNGKTTAAKIVLAVDDDALVLFNTTAMLEDLGHTFIAASSGSEALEILRKQKVDLVITDQAMPRMTGVQLIDAIKLEWPELPVILATGYAELPKGAASDAPRLNKPFGENELAAMMDKIVIPA